MKEFNETKKTLQLTLTFNNSDYMHIRYKGTLQQAEKHYVNSTFTDILSGGKIVCVKVEIYDIEEVIFYDL